MANLSDTTLAKRENFRPAFLRFDFERIAHFGEKDVKRLLTDKGIVRHGGKIEAVINNAKRALELVREKGSLAAHIWSYEPSDSSLAAPQTASISKESEGLSKDLSGAAGGSSGRPTFTRFFRRWV